MNFGVNKDAFYDDGHHVDFIATMTAFLGLSTDQVKIVGVKAKSFTRILSDGRLLQEQEGCEVETYIDDD